MCSLNSKSILSKTRKVNMSMLLQNYNVQFQAFKKTIKKMKCLKY